MSPKHILAGALEMLTTGIGLTTKSIILLAGPTHPILLVGVTSILSPFIMELLVKMFEVPD